jgi:alkylated DNA repair protein (DNA oxidative demethylase)
MMYSRNLFSSPREVLADGAILLRGFAEKDAAALMDSITKIAEAAPFRHLITPGGQRMSVAMTNCGTAGWISDRSGYRYDAFDPMTGRMWPDMPESFLTLARRAAAEGGFADFRPDVCLINRYEAGTRLTLHQDRDERDLKDPIVSVSLGLPAVFLFGGLRRADKPQRILVENGDVAVWGGPARLTYHGVDRLAAGIHPLTGPCRFNLTFRRST